MDMVAGGGVDWRQKLTPQLEALGIEVQNPVLMTNKLLQVSDPNEARWILRRLAEENQPEYCRVMEIIERQDIEAVERSNFIITYWVSHIPTYGTVGENWVAANRKIPIYCVCPAPSYVLPHWFRYDIYRSGGKKFNDFDELMEFLKQRKNIVEQNAHKATEI
jgi:hypothetical protein